MNGGLPAVTGSGAPRPPAAPAIRPLSLPDLPALGRLATPLPLGMDWDLTEPLRFRLLAWRSLFPYRMSGACSLVYRAAAIRALVQAEARPGRDKWTVLRAATATAADRPVLVPLLEALCLRAAAHGAGRVFAAASDDATTDLFRRLTFSAYATEMVYRTVGEEMQEEEVSRNPAPYAIRPQRARDVWGVHQLYCAVTPRPVQLIEGLISDDWESRAARWPGGPAAALEERLVLEAEAGIVGFVCLERGRRGHRLQIMVDSAHRHLATPLLQAALGVAADWAPVPIICSLRGYLAELGFVLEGAGFRQVGEQTLLAKEMAVRVRQRLRIFEPVLERALEPARSGAARM